MDTLYISDLDGTLLRSDATLSKRSKAILNGLIEKGLDFTIATARARETAFQILNGLSLDLPVILMNGVLIYSPKANEFIKVEYLPLEASRRTAKIFREHNTTGFMYKLERKETVTYYESLELPQIKAFYDNRTHMSDRKFARADSFIGDADESVIYFVLIDKREPLLRIREDILKIPGVSTTLYRDIYTDDYYFFEVFSDKASKGSASLFLKKHLCADKIICFGDNHNDKALFKASDEGYAVSNAHPKIKALATGLIGSNDEDGVALYLKDRFSKTTE